MWGVVRQIEKKRTLAIGADDPQCFIGEVIREVARGFKGRTAIEAHLPRMGGPEEGVDWIKGLFGVDHLRRILWQKQRGTGHKPQCLVKAMGLRAECRRFPQVPLADVDGVVTRFFQQSGQRNLAGG